MKSQCREGINLTKQLPYTTHLNHFNLCLKDLERKTGQFLNFLMQYMIPSELDIHNALYQEFLCLILFWCPCIATGEKELYTGKMILLESVEMCVHRRSPACPPRRASQVQAGWSNEGVIFPWWVPSSSSDCITCVLFGLQFPASPGQDNWGEAILCFAQWVKLGELCTWRPSLLREWGTQVCREETSLVTCNDLP